MQLWTADGLLAVFVLVAGIELRRELVVGDLRTSATAVFPVVGALCGMAVPAVLYLATARVVVGDSSGWAVPMATVIAFALAVTSTHLPPALRAFLLTLAVVNDLSAILVIAVFFTDGLNYRPGARCGVRGAHRLLPASAVPCPRLVVLRSARPDYLDAHVQQWRSHHRCRRRNGLHPSRFPAPRGLPARRGGSNWPAPGRNNQNLTKLPRRPRTSRRSHPSEGRGCLRDAQYPAIVVSSDRMGCGRCVTTLTFVSGSGAPVSSMSAVSAT